MQKRHWAHIHCLGSMLHLKLNGVIGFCSDTLNLFLISLAPSSRWSERAVSSEGGSYLHGMSSQGDLFSLTTGDPRAGLVAAAAAPGKYGAKALYEHETGVRGAAQGHGQSQQSKLVVGGPSGWPRSHVPPGSPAACRDCTTCSRVSGWLACCHAAPPPAGVQSSSSTVRKKWTRQQRVVCLCIA